MIQENAAPSPEIVVPRSLADLTSPELAQGVLDAALTGGHPSDVPFLQPEHFPMYTEQCLWRAILKFDAEGRPLDDIVSLGEYLTKQHPDNGYNWNGYLMKIVGRQQYGSLLAFVDNAQSIFNNWLRWQMICQANELMRKACNLSTPVDGEVVPGTHRFEVHSVAEALVDVPRPEWIVEPLIARGQVVMFFGESGTKKTWAALSLAVCCDQGKDWGRFKIARRFRVLYIDQDSGDPYVRIRIGMAVRGVGGDEKSPMRWMSMQELNLNDPQCRQELKKLFADEKPDIAFVDTMAAVATGDENSKEDMQPVMTFLRQLASDYHCAIVLIHHAGKSGLIRGSSAIKASLDVLVQLKSKQGSPFVDFATEKVRDGSPLQWSTRSVWVLHPDAPKTDQFYMEAVEGRQVEEGEGGLSPLRQWILDYLDENGESSWHAIADAGIKAEVGAKFSIRDNLYEMAQEGQIRRTNPEDRGKAVAARYALPEPEDTD